MSLSDRCTERFSVDNVFGQRKTYLSRNIEKLVCYQPEEELVYCQTDNKLFLEDGILDWMKIEKKCNLKECFSSTDGYNYQLAVSRLHPISFFIHNYLSQYTCEEFEQQYIVQLEWLTKRKVLLRCFHLIKTPEPGSIEASLLLITSTLERILGDIFMNYSNASHCPLLLRDLLGTRELKCVLGETVIHCLELYIGPPCGLNLRNLAWHGFLSQGEVTADYASFLLMMAISIGDLVKTKIKSLAKLKERPLIKYSEAKLLRECFPEVRTDNLADMFRKSNFVTSSMVEIWYLVLHFYEKERFADAVMIMLPQLEHSLRRVYACCNDLPEIVETAESSEFFTTFNEILSPILADGTCNKLPQTIGQCHTEMLLDILVHPEGPRLRDRIGHGEVDMFDFPKDFADHLLCFSVALCLKFSSDHERFTWTAVSTAFLEISKAAESYSSIFHPKSCLRRECLAYIDDLLEWEKLTKPRDEEFMCDNSQNSSNIVLCETTIMMVFRNYDHPVPRITQGFTEIQHCSCEVLLLLKETKLSTLFRPRRELEVVAILRNIVLHSSQTSKQIQQTATSRYEEWEQKELRSRQRNNYRRFLSHYPFIKQMMCLYVVVVVVELVKIENDDDENRNETQVKFLKRSLQCAENLESLSSSSRNRWQECADIGAIWMHKTCDYYSETSKKNTRE